MVFGRKYKSKIITGIVGVFLVLLIGSSVWKRNNLLCQNVAVEFDLAEGEENLVTREEVLKLISKNSTDYPNGKLFKALNFRELEERVLQNRLVKKCMVHQDWSGTLTVDIDQQKPLARLVTEQTGDKEGYLTEDGEVVPLSKYHTVKVLLVSGKYFQGVTDLKNKKSADLFAFIKKINEDEFWKAQITQLSVTKDGNISVIPEVGNHIIDFGIATDVETKLNKIKILYQKILPAKGWAKYKVISVKYRNQIVCE